MAEPRPRVVGVRFKNAGKIHYYDSVGMRLEAGEYVVVASTRGPELARVVIAPDQVLVDEIEHDDLPPVLRPASSGDLEKANQLTLRARDLLGEARALAAETGFRGTIQKLEYTLDGRRLGIHYASDERIDHREFAREASRRFDCRVDMHSLGPRDRSRLAGGYGICGRELCCANWLQSFPSISIRMAKEQDKPLNPEKISGLCGRLLCCLSYEDEGYKEMRRTLPKLGHRVSTPTGEAKVVGVNVLRRSITIQAEGVRLDIPDRDLGTVVRWDPSSKSAEPPESITRAEGVRRGLIESDDLDADETGSEWPPRSGSRYGRLPAAPVQPPQPPLPRGEAPAEDTRPGRERRRSRSGGRSRGRSTEPQPPRSGQQARKPRPESQEPPASGRSRVFRRRTGEGDDSSPSRPPATGPTDRSPSSGDQAAPRRRGRRGGRRRRGPNQSGGAGE